MNADYKPRFVFEITEEQQAKANKYLSIYGIRKAVMQVVLDDLLLLIEKHGQIIIGILLEKCSNPYEIIPILKQAERIANNASRKS